jgi:tetratricopeptide (TPR) repeat protein
MLIVPLTHLMLSGGDVVQAATAKAAPSIPRHVYLMTEFRVLVTYLRLLILPVNQNLYFDHPFYDSLLSPHVLIPLLFHLAVVVGGAYLWIKSRVGEPALRLAAFGVFWFYLGLAVESTFVPLHPIYEHRLYLPMAGLSVVAALVAVMLLERVRRPRARYAIALSYVGILLVFMSLTLARNTVWQSEISLWEDTASKSPLKDKVIDNLGMAFEREGRHQSAIEMFKSAISLKPDYAEPYNHLGPIYARRGMLRDAETMFKKAIELKPGFSDAHNNLGVLYETRGMFDKALFHYQKAAELSPNLAQVHYNMGILYDKMGKKNLAVNEFQLALRIDPGHARARQYLYRIRR